MAKFARLSSKQACLMLRAGYSLDGLYMRRTLVDEPAGRYWRVEACNAAGAVLFVEGASATSPDDLAAALTLVHDALAWRVITYAKGVTIAAAKAHAYRWRVRTWEERLSDLTCQAEQASAECHNAGSDSHCEQL